jgi:hypothetical protein
MTHDTHSPLGALKTEREVYNDDVDYREDYKSEAINVCVFPACNAFVGI